MRGLGSYLMMVAASGHYFLLATALTYSWPSSTSTSMTSTSGGSMATSGTVVVTSTTGGTFTSSDRNPTVDDENDAEALAESDGDSSDGLSTGAIAGISAAVLALVGGGIGLAFKHNSIHCCTFNQHISHSSPA
ncbi:unnamed protein product [Scytosiphon promiscuus]